MWKKLTLTTAANSANVSFEGNGSVFAEGTFGGGVVEYRAVAVDPLTGVKSSSSTSVGAGIDGSAILNATLPSGHYELVLSGSTGATVDVYYNDQKVLVE